jgi:hypothetical protein
MVMALLLHATLHASPLPVSWSWVQALPSSQLAGQVVAGSQVSPASTMPLPQTAGAPPVGEMPPTPVTPPLLVPPPVPPPSIPAAPPPVDSTDESDVPHEAIVAAKLTTKTVNEAFFGFFISQLSCSSPGSIAAPSHRRANVLVPVALMIRPYPRECGNHGPERCSGVILLSPVRSVILVCPLWPQHCQLAPKVDAELAARDEDAV